MSSYKRGSKQKNSKDKPEGRESTYENIVLDKKVESLIQDLKNCQRCYAEAANLVNSSQLRNTFEKIQLERTIFMEEIAKSLQRLDLVSGLIGHSADVVWFASVEVTNISRNDFDLEILARCLRCEEAIAQAYESVLDFRKDRTIYPFLVRHKLDLEKSEQKLQDLRVQFEA